MPEEHPAAVTVTKMAELVGLSRSRFYELVRSGIFPAPVETEAMNRPVYVRDQIEECLEIRRTGVGANGLIVTFNRRKKAFSKAGRPPQPTSSVSSSIEPIVTGLKSLNLDVEEAVVAAAINEHFPEGIESVDQGVVISTLFRALRG